MTGGVHLTSLAVCLAGCGWTCEGDPGVVDLAARRHFGEAGLANALRPGHSVTVTTTPIGGRPPKATPPQTTGE